MYFMQIRPVFSGPITYNHTIIIYAIIDYMHMYIIMPLIMWDSFLDVRMLHMHVHNIIMWHYVQRENMST